MNVDRIIVREYLESLTEKNELNRIFPILLDAMNFNVLSQPTVYLGLQEYGKDFVAVGQFPGAEKKKYFFELKGGADRHITEENFYGKDGIQDSISQASYNQFVSAYEGYENLPLEIIIVHNGLIDGNVQSTFENFCIRTQATLVNTTISRWDITKLTELFSNHLFGPYLLCDQEASRAFNRVLINLNNSTGVSKDFDYLIDRTLNFTEWTSRKGSIPRKWEMAFESLKLIALIIYTEAKRNNNYDISKRYLNSLTIQFWSWILKNKLENRKAVTKYFKNLFDFHQSVLDEYFSRTLPIAIEFDGLYYPNAGGYEQIGYTNRVHEYVWNLVYSANHTPTDSPEEDESLVKIVWDVITRNSVSSRPLLDIHSLPIIDATLFFISKGRTDLAQQYLLEVMGNIMFSYQTHKRLPDASNNIQNVVKYFATGVKPVYYIDSISPLIAATFEILVVLELEEAFETFRDFILKNEIDLGLFIPHHGKTSNSRDLISDLENDLEEQLFTKSVNDGFQAMIPLLDDNRDPLSYNEYKSRVIQSKDEFTYDYRTDKSGYPGLRDLAHYIHSTPYFPDKWRIFLKKN